MKVAEYVKREFAKVFPREVHFNVHFNEDETIEVEVEDARHLDIYLMEIGSDDDCFWFENADGHVIVFPLPDEPFEEGI